jgi:hypothetical protein
MNSALTLTYGESMAKIQKKIIMHVIMHVIDHSTVAQVVYERVRVVVGEGSAHELAIAIAEDLERVGLGIGRKSRG